MFGLLGLPPLFSMLCSSASLTDVGCLFGACGVLLASQNMTISDVQTGACQIFPLIHPFTVLVQTMLTSSQQQQKQSTLEVVLENTKSQAVLETPLKHAPC